MKRFPIKSVVKIVIAVIAFLIAITLIQSPVLTNETALSQMDTSDGAYIAWSSCAAVVAIVKYVLCGISGFILGIYVFDIYKYIKNM